MTAMSSFAFECASTSFASKTDNIEDIYFVKYDSNEEKTPIKYAIKC